MKPRKCISIEEARKQQDEWIKTRGKDIERGEGYEDTREFWCSLDELQEYLDYVRKKSEEQGVKKPGIRLYLGAYPNSENKKSYSTIFLAPTKEKKAEDGQIEEGGNDNNYDINPMNTLTGGKPPYAY